MQEFVVLTGYPGSGKSTVAKSYKEEGYEVVSSDSVREKLYGSEEIQGNPKEVFHAAQVMAAIALDDGKSVVFDSTALSPKERMETLNAVSDLSRNDSYKKISLHIDTDIGVAKVLNETRDRRVPDYAYIKMERRYREPSFEEGFDEIKTAHVFLDRDKVDQMDLRKKENLMRAIDRSNHLNSYGEENYSIENGRDLVTVLNSAFSELEENPDLFKTMQQEDAKSLLYFRNTAESIVPYEAYKDLEPISQETYTQLRNIATDVHEIQAKELADDFAMEI